MGRRSDAMDQPDKAGARRKQRSRRLRVIGEPVGSVYASGIVCRVWTNRSRPAGPDGMLSSYLSVEGVPPVDTAGAWHLSCLASEPVAVQWGLASVHSFVQVRRFDRVARVAGWTVVDNPRSGNRLALGDFGAVLALRERGIQSGSGRVAGDHARITGWSGISRSSRESRPHCIAPAQSAGSKSPICSASGIVSS
jgi:hypothetical protein